MDQRAIEAGRDFERHFCRLTGARLVPQSGAGAFAKLDARDQHIRWSLKWTSRKSFALTPSLLDEADEGVKGRDELPALAVQMSGVDEPVVSMRLSAFLELMNTETARWTGDSSKSSAKTSAAALPELLRPREDVG